jgi:hypothetical protein
MGSDLINRTAMAAASPSAVGGHASRGARVHADVPDAEALPPSTHAHREVFVPGAFPPVLVMTA